MPRTWSNSVGAAALSLVVVVGLGMYAPALAVEPAMTEGTPLPALPAAPFASTACALPLRRMWLSMTTNPMRTRPRS